MEYRKLGNTDLVVSAIGLGTEYLTNQTKETINDVLRTAVEAGITYIDLLWENPDWWSNFELVFQQYRNRFILAAHWGGNLNQVGICQQNFDGILTRLCHNYADIALVTMIDTEVKWKGRAQEALERLMRYKEQGRIGTIGASSHYAQIARKMVDSGLIDMLMYPVNMFRDEDDENRALYKACVDHGVGLVKDEIWAEYEAFPVKASNCIECGECLDRCPFNVDIIAKIRQVVENLETPVAT
jgi:predicted aldo/keto reductase-like oxidoreductase